MDEHIKHPNNGKKVKFKSNSVGSKKENTRWVIVITIVGFILSSGLSFASSILLENVDLIFSFLIVLIIVVVGIIFDTIGIAVTAADEAPFHSMASRKFYGARQAIKLVRNANKVSSICNDVVGDICGVISGAAIGFIIIAISQSANLPTSTIVSLSLTGVVAALTIGGKAIGKTIALKHSNYIVYKVSIVLSFITKRHLKTKI
ncbi:Mg2+ and Co2+ transporter CorB [Herbivorax sp. ANBcel31]|uniref:Mg2+ and Co2+ transporter CorB n=1 Tax=Herbivorax sp. ANBcel31 TaxID=3069754 RepID=UPI0027B23E58|nr:Mg2+ and Co2+ transporter CorB [Herbivorax sp. ANBcel31]MDQ2085314.1 Mg2+ and Co2+ transporter CorB [Herbivorax sp. ANBcel31]